jgi:protein TonB
LIERLRSGAGRRTFGIGAALLIEALLLFLLLSLGLEEPKGEREPSITLVDVRTPDAADEVSEPSSAEPASQSEQQPEPQRPPAEQPPLPRTALGAPRPPAEAQPAPLPRPVLPEPEARSPAFELPASAAPPAARSGKVYGPVDSGGSRASRDSERVGTAPNGEPLYAASWYREPERRMLSAYLSTARGPGWGLIACRTAPDYRVEDCVPLDEYPQGSQINRAVLAAAWEFRVRPARIGGRSQVGSWVRIRIDYSTDRR